MTKCKYSNLWDLLKLTVTKKKLILCKVCSFIKQETLRVIREFGNVILHENIRHKAGGRRFKHY